MKERGERVERASKIEKEKKNMQGEKQLNNSQSECCYREMKAL